MTINTEGFYVHLGKWKAGGGHSTSGQGKQSHSEIVVYNALGKKDAGGPFLIKQDAFPCHECDGKFQGQTLSVLVKVTANNGKYSADHGLGQNPAAAIYPYYVWYHGGAKTVGTAIAPPGFPAIPAFAGI